MAPVQLTINTKNMKRLVAMLVLALPTALFAQVDLPTSEIIINAPSNQLEMPGVDAILLADIPDAFINGYFDDGTMFGSNLSNTIGYGVEFGTDGVSISGLGLGLSYNYTIQQINAQPFLVLNATFDGFGLPSSGSVLVGFDTMGISSDSAVDLMGNGNLDAMTFSALYNGSSLDMQASLEQTMDAEAFGGYTADGNYFEGSTDDLQEFADWLSDSLMAGSGAIDMGNAIEAYDDFGGGGFGDDFFPDDDDGWDGGGDTGH